MDVDVCVLLKERAAFTGLFIISWQKDGKPHDAMYTAFESPAHGLDFGFMIVARPCWKSNEEWEVNLLRSK